jgi:hypothetical protein
MSLSQKAGGLVEDLDYVSALSLKFTSVPSLSLAVLGFRFRRDLDIRCEYLGNLIGTVKKQSL